MAPVKVVLELRERTGEKTEPIVQVADRQGRTGRHSGPGSARPR